MHIQAVQVRTFVKVGDKVPVTYLKGKTSVPAFFLHNKECFFPFTDETVPLVKADSEYPEWLFTIAEKVRLKLSSILLSIPFITVCVVGSQQR